MKIAELSRAGEGIGHAVAKSLYGAYLGAWYTVTSRRPFGTNVYDEEWDVLIVLDACRVDALRAVADEYDFIESVGTRWSVGSHSIEWLAKTFTVDRLEEVRNTAYLTANPNAQLLFVDGVRPPKHRSVPGWPTWKNVGADDFWELEMIWEGGHDERLGNTPPRRVTDRLVDVVRTGDVDRVIAHYMQPHLPYIGEAYAEDRETTPLERAPLTAFSRGEVSRERVWEMYLDNLRTALDDVALALENLDAETVVVTADHGEAMGEWGDVDHREGNLHPAVKRVPWVVTGAADRGTYEPEPTPEAEPTASVEDRLRDLGYV